LVDDQVKVELPPLATVAGLALRETLGGGEVTGAEETVTVADWDAEPPAPVHVSVYLVVVVRGEVVWEPLVARLPDQPSDAVHAVASVDDQVNVELPPLATPAGLVVSETVGGALETVTVAVWDAEPPAPVHVSVYLVVVVRGEVVWEPLVGSVPLHPPEAVQFCASAALQFKVTARPTTTVLGVVPKVIAGVGLAAEGGLDAAPAGLVLVCGLTCPPHAAKVARIDTPIAERRRRATA
jgi:hypothetical protein